jgi:hypothetical protein
MLPDPPPDPLLVAMAALGWRTPLPEQDAKSELAALDQALALRSPLAKKTTLDEIRRRTQGSSSIRASGIKKFLQTPDDEVDFWNIAARADEIADNLDLSPELLERMRQDEEEAKKKKDYPDQ